MKYTPHQQLERAEMVANREPEDDEPEPEREPETREREEDAVLSDLCARAWAAARLEEPREGISEPTMQSLEQRVAALERRCDAGGIYE